MKFQNTYISRSFSKLVESKREQIKESCPVVKHRVYYKGEGNGFPPSPSRGESYESVFINGESCESVFTRGESCEYVFARGESCEFVFARGESCESVFARGESMHQRCYSYTLTNLLFGLCKSV